MKYDTAKMDYSNICLSLVIIIARKTPKQGNGKSKVIRTICILRIDEALLLAEALAAADVLEADSLDPSVPLALVSLAPDDSIAVGFAFDDS